MLTIKVSMELDFSDLKGLCWSGARETLERIENESMEDEFMDYINQVFELLYEDSDAVDMAELNDFIWFERDTIYEALGIEED